MNIYVGNISMDTSEDELREAFAPFGDIASVRILRDRATGESRGFGFVEMPAEAQAKAAIEAMNGKELKGSALSVEAGRARATGMGGGRPSRGPGGPRGGRPGGRPGGRGPGRGPDRGSGRGPGRGPDRGNRFRD